jgi:hypothetical protein
VAAIVLVDTIELVASSTVSRLLLASDEVLEAVEVAIKTVVVAVEEADISGCGSGLRVASGIELITCSALTPPLR